MWRAYLAVLLAGLGCHAVPETACRYDGQSHVSSARPLPSKATAATNSSDIVPVAHSTLSEGELETGDDEGSNAGYRLQTLPNHDVTQDRPGGSAEPMSLTLHAAIQTALQQNPDLQTVRSGEPVAHAAYRVAKTYPFNPQFQTQVLPYTRERDGSGAPVSQQYVIVQTFELGGQRQFRTGAAAADWQRVRGEIRAAELRSMAEAERLFFAALYQRELRDSARSLAKLNADLVGVLGRRFQAGQAGNADVGLARLEAQSARRQAGLAQADYQTALMNLTDYLNLDATRPLELAGQWTDWKWRSVTEAFAAGAVEGAAPKVESHDSEPSTLDSQPSTTVNDGMLRQLVAERPDVTAARAATETARANLSLADADRTPDLQIGPMWARDDAATEFWGVQGQVDIPIVNNGMPMVRQRAAELRQKEITAMQLEAQGVAEARSALRRYEQARRLVQSSRGDLDGLRNELDQIEKLFEAGQVDLLRVFAARNSMLQVRRNQMKAWNEVAQAAADVTRTTGMDPHLLFSPNADQQP